MLCLSDRSRRSEEHTSELQSLAYLVCRLLLEKKKLRCSDLFYTILLTHCFSFFFFNDTATTEIYTLSLHDALPIFTSRYSDSTTVVPSIARLPSVQSCSRSFRNVVCLFSSSPPNALFVGP